MPVRLGAWGPRLLPPRAGAALLLHTNGRDRQLAHRTALVCEALPVPQRSERPIRSSALRLSITGPKSRWATLRPPARGPGPGPMGSEGARTECGEQFRTRGAANLSQRRQSKWLATSKWHEEQKKSQRRLFKSLTYREL